MKSHILSTHAPRSTDGGSLPLHQERVRIGIVGAGHFAAEHIEAFRQLPEAEIVALARRNPEKLRADKARWGIPHAFTDYRELLELEEVDAVSIVTPTDSHYSIAMDAIHAGKHILCEKPLALKASAAMALLEAARERQLVHVINFNQRSRTAVGSMQRLAAEGFVGEASHLNVWWGLSLQYDVQPGIGSWRFRPENGGGTLYELVHVFDFARFLMGEVRRLCALTSTSERFRPFQDAPDGMAVNVPDSSACLLEFESGTTGVLHTSFLSRGVGPSGTSEPRIELTGTRGRLVTVEGNRLKGICDGQGRLREVELGEPYPTPYAQLVRALSRGEPVRTSFHDGYEAARLVDAANLSASEGRWVWLHQMERGDHEQAPS
jgi:predicted dehydrogenase